MSFWRRPGPDPWGGPEMDRKGALWSIVNPIILLVIDPCCDPLRTGLLLHPYGWLTRQLQLAAQVPYASFRNSTRPVPLDTTRNPHSHHQTIPRPHQLATTTASARGGCKTPHSKVVVVVAVVVAVPKVQKSAL